MKISAELVNKLRYFVEKSGSSLEPLDFYHNVQMVFHDVESELYDQIHSDMFVRLEIIFNEMMLCIVRNDVTLRILDIGAGTGLVEEMLHKKYACIVDHIQVIEPNVNMIRCLKRKNANWRLPIEYFNSYLKRDLPIGQFDLIVCSSVLHHILDLEEFFSGVDRYLVPGGHILTMQDPRREVIDDPVAKKRKDSFNNNRLANKQTLCLKDITRQIKNTIKRYLPYRFAVPRDPMRDKVNTILKRKNIIVNELSMEEIWAITDIHVPGQPGKLGNGIALADLLAWLPNYTNIKYKTYNYFDTDFTQLSEDYKFQEMKLFNKNDMHGYHFASIFKKIR